MEEEERVFEVDWWDRGRGQGAKGRREAPGESCVKEFEGSICRETSSSAKAEYRDYIQKDSFSFPLDCTGYMGELETYPGLSRFELPLTLLPRLDLALPEV